MTRFPLLLRTGPGTAMTRGMSHLFSIHAENISQIIRALLWDTVSPLTVQMPPQSSV